MKQRSYSSTYIAHDKDLDEKLNGWKTFSLSSNYCFIFSNSTWSFVQQKTWTPNVHPKHETKLKINTIKSTWKLLQIELHHTYLKFRVWACTKIMVEHVIHSVWRMLQIPKYLLSLDLALACTPCTKKHQKPRMKTLRN